MAVFDIDNSEMGNVRAQHSNLDKAVRRYWDAHPIGTDDAPFERGSREQFEAIYRRWQQHGTPKRQEFLDSCRGRKVLEIGCGIAKDGRFLSENGIDYYAVDLSIESLILAGEHFRQNNLRNRFANADATQLPFREGSFDFVFSIGVLHHVPDTRAACREATRVLHLGGRLRVMIYNRNSYHYFLVCYVVLPLIWLFLRLPFLHKLARLGPTKFQNMYEISKVHGFSKQRLLNVSTDTSVAGEDKFNPHSKFYVEKDLRDLFHEFEELTFWKTDLRYFPLPWFRKFFESHFGFFIQMTACKRASGSADHDATRR